MVTERFGRLSSERRSLILNAAMSEFASAGLAKGNLQNVAKGAGVSKGLLYYYFEDREDILASLYAEVGTLLVSIVGTAPEKPHPGEFWDWIDRIYHNVLDVMSRQPVLMGFVARILAEVSHGLVPPGFEKHSKGTRLAVMEVVGLGQRCGAIRTDLPEPLLVRAVMHMMGACDRWILSEAQAGKLSASTPDVVLNLYKSAFAAPVVLRKRKVKKALPRRKKV
jgi:AcrR family transcriptional regulator